MKAEYYIDSDSGAGKGLDIAVAVGDSINISNISIPATGLALGPHTSGVRVKGSDGFWSSGYCVTFNVVVVTSVQNDESENKAYVSPNPATDVLNIYWSIAQTGNVELLLYNSIGELLKQETIEKFQHDWDFQLLLQELQNGFFVLKPRCGGKQFQAKFIKQ